MADPNRSVAVARNFRDDFFLADTPVNTIRGLETTRSVLTARTGFLNQADVDSFVTARGGATGYWIFLDLSTLGVR